MSLIGKSLKLLWLVCFFWVYVLIYSYKTLFRRKETKKQSSWPEWE